MYMVILSGDFSSIDPHTRVPLFLKFGVANSDYINANYIRVSALHIVRHSCVHPFIHKVSSNSDSYSYITCA